MAYSRVKALFKIWKIILSVSLEMKPSLTHLRLDLKIVEIIANLKSCNILLYIITFFYIIIVGRATSHLV